MDHLITALVTAETSENAVTVAKTAVFEEVAGVFRHPFDYYTVCKEEESGSPIAVRADTAEGEQLVEEAMEKTERRFRQNFVTAFLAIKYLSCADLRESSAVESTVELGDKIPQDKIEEKLNAHNVDRCRHLHSPRYAFYQLGRRRGPHIHLYDGTDWSRGDGITSRRALDTVHRRAKNQKHPLWVVQAKVHL